AEAAQAAVEVAGRGAEEHATQCRQHRVADPAVQPRHGAGPGAAAEAVAHDQLVALAQAFYERVDGAEVVGVVRIAHDDVAPARRLDPGPERGAIAPLRHRHDASPQLGRDLDGRVGTAV